MAHTYGRAIAEVNKVQVRLFALCHERRNLAKSEGYVDEDEDEALLTQLLDSASQLLSCVIQRLTGL